MPAGAHSIKQLAEPDVLDSSLATHCDKHAEETAEFYCFDCKVNICSKCFTDSHKQHKCEKAMAAACRKVILQIDGESKKLSDSVKTLKKQVKERGEAVKRVVDRHVKDLLDELDKMR